MKLRSLLLIPAIAIADQVCADAQTFNRSAKNLRAKITAVGKGRESRVEIRSAHGRLINWKSFVSNDGEHGQVIERAVWTTNADFFVFNTTKTGGHQPWSRAIYFYSRRENKFYLLDSFIGPVTSDFTLREDVLTTKRFRWENDNPEPKEKRVVVRLNRLRL